MPPITALGNIEIFIYWNDTKKHKRPHFHAVGPERASIFGIPELDHIVGDLKGKEMKTVLEWADANAEHLQSLWNQRNPGFPLPQRKEGA